MSLISRRHNCSQRRENMKMCRRYVQRARQRERERDGEETQCLLFRLSTLNFPDSCFPPYSPFSSVSSPNCPLQRQASNQKVSAGRCPRNIKKKKKSASDVYTQCCEHGSVLRFVFRPSSLSLSLSLFIPQWLTCFTSTAVISTAFTELINGAEGWVPLNWDNSFSLSLAHMDNCMEKHRKDRGRSAREGGRIHTQSGKTKTKLEGIDVEE